MQAYCNRGFAGKISLLALLILAMLLSVVPVAAEKASPSSVKPGFTYTRDEPVIGRGPPENPARREEQSGSPEISSFAMGHTDERGRSGHSGGEMKKPHGSLGEGLKLGHLSVDGRASGKIVQENLKMDNGLISSYGASFGLIGRGRTPQFQELRYRYQAPDKHYSYLALEAPGLKSIEVYEIKRSIVEAAENRKKYRRTRERLEIKEVASTLMFLHDWRRDSPGLSSVRKKVQGPSILGLNS
ncbi:MAG: hypothetical protein SVS85_03295, partial [Candidatus Nanohaloarchaea archaeon]|nr:hypothetical protein [Candidatus Nanohaloarchaea archaeon]